MQLPSNNRILFVFSDPGGAKPLLALIENSQVNNYKVFSDRIYPFYKDFGITISDPPVDWHNELEEYAPNIVVTGTSYTSSLELDVLSIAADVGIFTISFVDHWTNISNRFSSKKYQALYPNEIWLVDERAKMIAINEGIDEGRLKVIGNPYHQWLNNWEPEVDKQEYLNTIGINNNAPVLLFGPDSLSNVDGKRKYGFDEISATKDILDLMEGSLTDIGNCNFLIKPHPNQNVEPLMEIVNNYPFASILSSNVDTNTVLYYSDVVIGFFSSLLLESCVLNKKVIRFIPTPINNDPFENMNVGEKVDCSTFINRLKLCL